MDIISRFFNYLAHTKQKYKVSEI